MSSVVDLLKRTKEYIWWKREVARETDWLMQVLR